MKAVFGIVLVTTCLLAQLAWAGAPKAEYYAIPGNPELPFSEAVRVGHMLYLSGNIGNLPGSDKLAPGGISAETTQALENIKTSLEKHGSSMSEVVKCTVYLADIREWAAMNEVYKTYFPSRPPARSAFGTSGLSLGARTEIECLATVR